MAASLTASRRIGRAVASPGRSAAISLAIAGGAHLGAFPAHRTEGVLVGGFFLVAAVLQVLAAVVMTKRVTPATRTAIVAGTIGVTLVWAISRTIGLPLGGHSGGREGVGLLDATAVAAQLETLRVLGSRRTSAPGRAPIRAGILLIPFIAVAAGGAWLTPSSHAHGHHGADTPAHHHPPAAAADTSPPSGPLQGQPATAPIPSTSPEVTVPVDVSVPEPAGHSNAPGGVHSGSHAHP